MRYRINRLVLKLLILIMLTSLFSITALADVKDKGNVGDATGGSKSGGGLVWMDTFAGYRFAIVNQNFEQVSNTVDIVFDEPYDRVKNLSEWYTSSRADKNMLKYENDSKYIYLTEEQIYSNKDFKAISSHKYPPRPIESSGGDFISKGKEFKKWFLKDGGNVISSKPASSYSGSTGSGSSKSYSSVSSGSSGTTKPQENTGKSKDLPGVNESLLLRSVAYRNEKKADAKKILEERGELGKVSRRASNLASAVNASAISMVEREVEKEFQKIMRQEFSGSDVDEEVDVIARADPGGVSQRKSKIRDSIGPKIRGTLVKAEMVSCENTSNSYAEAIYTYIIIIERVLGASFQDTAYNIMDGGNTLVYEDCSVLEQIPLSRSIENGYATIILNFKEYKKDSAGNEVPEYLFKLPGTIAGNDEISVTDVMIENKYAVIVEPVFWFKPANHDGTKVVSPIHSNYVYGTVANHIDFQHNNGYKFGSRGGAYASLMGKLGYRCMFIEENWVGSGRTIKGVKDPKSDMSLKALRPKIHGDEGWAIHIYVTKEDSLQVTRDINRGDSPHPAPDPKNLVEPDDIDGNPITKEYTIAKYYVEEHLNESKNVENSFEESHVRVGNPHKIKINEEDSYKVQDWFISKEQLLEGTNKSYEEAKIDAISKGSLTREGKQTEIIVELDVKREYTLHMLLKKQEISVGLSDIDTDGKIILEESELTKYITTMDKGLPNWGARLFEFKYGSMAGSDTHYCGGCRTNKDGESYCPGHSCSAKFGDSSYEYIIKNSAVEDKLIETMGLTSGNDFRPQMVNNKKSGTAKLRGGTDSIDTAEYRTIIWRGLDVPTIASYKEPSINPIKGILNKYGNTPIGNRAANGFYLRDLIIQLNVSEDSDLETHSVHSYNNATWHTVRHSFKPVHEHAAEVVVMTYRGNNKKQVGDVTKSGVVGTIIPFGGVVSNNSLGYMVQGDTPIQFYPYIKMTCQTMGSVTSVLGATKEGVSILSQFYSEILPNDFAEVAWYNPNESESLLISSTQWSMHAKAINGGQSWNGKNQVLPGGALYHLGTGKEPTKIALVTWQTIMNEPERSALAVKLPSNEYTVSKANTIHKNFVDQSKTVLDKYRVVQWVNADVDVPNAWTNNGKSIKITGGGQSLSPLGLSGHTSTESKYVWSDGSAGSSTNAADLDIISESNSTDTFFKVFADVSGDIYLAKSIGSIDSINNSEALKSVCQGKISIENVTVTKILGKEVTESQVESRLTGEARELNNRTLLVTNLVRALERNTGNDKTAEWATDDGKWYNEAWDGIIVMRKATTLEVGFKEPATRTIALDPKLCPPCEGKSDLFSKAFVSQFRLDSKSTIEDFGSKPNGFIAMFKGKDVILPNIEDMYISKKFFIPNVNVQDL